jgi:hypothetical protein
MPVSDSEARRYFLIARSQGVCEKTKQGELDMATKYGFSISDMASVHDRIGAAAYRSGQKRLSDNEPMRRVKLYPSTNTMLDLTLEPAETLPNRNVQALWFVCCATGNRPTNLYDANFEVTASCLAVTFPKRKVRSKGRESLEFPWR